MPKKAEERRTNPNKIINIVQDTAALSIPTHNLPHVSNGIHNTFQKINTVPNRLKQLKTNFKTALKNKRHAHDYKTAIKDLAQKEPSDVTAEQLKILQNLSASLEDRPEDNSFLSKRKKITLQAAFTIAMIYMSDGSPLNIPKNIASLYEGTPDTEEIHNNHTDSAEHPPEAETIPEQDSGWPINGARFG